MARLPQVLIEHQRRVPGREVSRNRAPHPSPAPCADAGQCAGGHQVEGVAGQDGEGRGDGFAGVVAQPSGGVEGGDGHGPGGGGVHPVAGGGVAGGGAAVAGGGDEAVDRLAQDAGGEQVGGVGASGVLGAAVGAEPADPGVEGGGAGELLDRAGGAAVPQGRGEVQAGPPGAPAERGRGGHGRRG
nr:hypothetical protein [Actinomadura verrucosospora]